MIDLSIAPGRFIQEKGLIFKIGDFLREYGKRPLFLADRTVASIIEDKIKKSLKKVGLPFKLTFFGGECCQEEIEKVTDTIKTEKIDIMIGCGGGKAIDTAKAAAYYTKVPFVSVPTSAATCAAWSSICPTYSREGRYLGTKEFKKSPTLVLVDSKIIAEAPSRLLSAGMADSLAKWYEGRTSSQKFKEDFHVALALNLSDHLRRIIEKNGPDAKVHVDRKFCSPQVEKIIEANILLAGLIGEIGGKNFRSTAAHAFNYALSGIPKFAHTLHGERVGIGLLIQLILEKKRDEFINLVQFYRKIGFPCSLEELGVQINLKELDQICARVCSDPRINNLPFYVDKNIFQDAFLKVNTLIETFSKRRAINDTVSTSQKR